MFRAPRVRTTFVRPSASRRANTTPTSTRETNLRKRNSSRSTKPMKSYRIPRSASVTTSWDKTGRPAPTSLRRPAGKACGSSTETSAIYSAPDVGRADSAISSSRCSEEGRVARAGAGFRMRGQDIEAEIALPIEAAHRGMTRSLSLQATETCPDCAGTGRKDNKMCPTCRGAGVISRPKSLEVTIPAGVREGSVIRLAGQGDPGTDGGPPGDLFLHVRLEPHPLFRIQGDDVQIELPVAPWEAALGGRVNVPTLDGPVDMAIPAGAQGGQRLRLRGQGLNRRGGGQGRRVREAQDRHSSEADGHRKRSVPEARRSIALQCARADEGIEEMNPRRYEMALLRDARSI